MLQKAAKLKSQGKALEALDILQQALQIEPYNIRALNGAVETAQTTGSPCKEEFSERLARMEIEREKRVTVNIPGKLQDDFVFEQLNDLDEAFELLTYKKYEAAEVKFKSILENDSSNHRALFGLGKIHFLINDYSTAKKFFRQSVDIKLTGNALLALAEAYEKLNNPDEAFAALDLLSDTFNVNGQFNFDIARLKGHCSLRQGKYLEAQEFYHQSAAFDSYSEKPCLGLGSLELMRKNFSAAEEHFHNALRKNPRSDKAKLGLALLRFEQDRSEEALELAKQALNLNIENQQAMLLCVQAGHKAGKLDQTEKYLARYAQIHHLNTEILYTLAGVRFSLGKKNQALQTAREILNIQPGNQAAAELIEKMG